VVINCQNQVRGKEISETICGKTMQNEW
jgi:hypothetical protein